MNVVAVIGTSVGYTESGHQVTIETNDGRVAVAKRDVFYDLYIRLNKYSAALKEDCVAYNESVPGKFVEVFNRFGQSKIMKYDDFARMYDVNMGD